MAQLRLYIETSVWSHYHADDAPDRRDDTRRFFDWCEAAGSEVSLFVSAFVLREMEKADAGKRRELEDLLRRYGPDVFAPTDAVSRLSGAYIRMGAIPPAKEFDALHAAMATVHGVDALVSWNYRHLVNMSRCRKINGVNLIMGYPNELRIVTPPEVIDDEVQQDTD